MKRIKEWVVAMVYLWGNIASFIWLGKYIGYVSGTPLDPSTLHGLGLFGFVTGLVVLGFEMSQREGEK